MFLRVPTSKVQNVQPRKETTDNTRLRFIRTFLKTRISTGILIDYSFFRTFEELVLIHSSTPA